jgi:3-isopropylmalate dehydrogenase
MIGSFAMALRYSFNLGALADRLDAAIASALASGLRTRDIANEGARLASTSDMGNAVVAALRASAG